MARPVEARLVDLRRHELAWPFIAYAIVTGAVHADTDLLFAKNFGHSVFRWIKVLFPDDIARLEDAATRLGAASPRVAVRGAVQLAVAFAGRAPSALTVEDLDQLAAVIDTSPRLSEPMRRSRRADLFRLRRFLFEAGMVTLPAQHCREGGPATREARLAVVPAPEVRRTLTKTRVANGYCSRDLVAEACAYANICGTCPNYVTAPEFAPAIEAQLADIHTLRDDADQRGWTSETARHDRVIASLERHLQRINNDRSANTSP